LVCSLVNYPQPSISFVQFPASFFASATASSVFATTVSFTSTAIAFASSASGSSDRDRRYRKMRVTCVPPTMKRKKFTAARLWWGS
jgi:hypothetical protein